nr:retrovirus-related Pol polyprotein from transposon TNT 1-94 [Tanacetum cinerariifolium]
MLADAKLLVTFWAEAVNTACYVQNRVLVNKSQNKTLYELFNGRTPAIGFLKQFGYHVMILNTLDHLGKFEVKGDEVIDDFSRFTWTFFLKSKDETSGILKKFITEIENQKDLKVKIIRCDNGGEFRNKEMNDFCLQKGIKREFSNARTPQQNGVAKRRNRTLIEVARTMLVDAKLPVTFWAEAVNTACYVQNSVLVNKSNNKTPYELFNGRSPTIGFLKPFGCYVMILNTLDNLGKFEEKGDEGYFIGYSMSSKTFRVFNKRTRRVEENLHVEFLENKAIEKGSGPNWLFDIDSLTKSMNYVPVDAGIGNPNPTTSTSNPPADQMETLTVETPIPTRKGLNLEQESAKKQKTSEEVPEEEMSPEEVPEEKVKEMMHLVPIEEVYVEALQVNHPIIDWKVYIDGQRSYRKITRLGGSSASYQFFINLLKHLDREDLNQVWILVKETLSNRPPTSDKEMDLWVELSRLYEPDNKDQLWTHIENFMHALVEWKLYDTCGVYHVTSNDKEIFMLVEKDYPLRKGLALVMISYKLQVKNYSHMANDLILKIYKIANSPRQQEQLHTASEERCHCQKKSEASTRKIALLSKVKKKLVVITLEDPVINSFQQKQSDDKRAVIPPRMRTCSAGQTIIESQGGGTGERVGRGGRGRGPRGGGAPNFLTIIAQQLKNLLPTILAQVGNQGNVESQNGNVVNETIHENVRNVLVNSNRVGYSYKEFLACKIKEYDGNGGVVVLTLWIKKMESMQDISGCSIDQKVKYITGSFVGKALMWVLYLNRPLTLNNYKGLATLDKSKNTKSETLFED